VSDGLARLIQSMGHLDAASALEDEHWPLARPYRRLAAGPIGDVRASRRARGTSPRPPRR